MSEPSETCSASEDGHCGHWYDCEPCCRCGDDTVDPHCDCDRCITARSTGDRTNEHGNLIDYGPQFDELDECIHGLGPVEACVICNGRAKREEAEQAEQPRTFAARYGSHCDECNLPIHIGQIVAWLPERRVTHEACWPTIAPH